MGNGNVFLVPCPLGDNDPTTVLPKDTIDVIHQLEYFIVENEKTARRFLRAAGHPKAIRELHFEILNKHTHPNEIANFLLPCMEGKNVGIISEAGCPGVADPGAVVVKKAHTKKLKVIPLIGPSSLLLALMASGFNGQSFCFNGYLPKDKGELKRKIKGMEALSAKTNQTQIFIETPFRNEALFNSLVDTCSPNTLLCIAANLNQENEFVKTLPIKNWKGSKPSLKKIPTVFLLHSV